MTTPQALVRPDDRVREVIGTDGLTDEERAEFEAAYHVGVGRKTLSAGEKSALALWLSRRAAS